MSDSHGGGYRKPADPAPVSGPGALSQRTDGGAATQPEMLASGGPYGSRQEMASIQGGAPMAGTASSLAGLTPIGAPSARPDEPVTAGAAAGAGLSPQAAGIQSDEQVTNEQLRPLLQSLELMANLPSSNPETRTLVRNLKARLSNG